MKGQTRRGNASLSPIASAFRCLTATFTAHTSSQDVPLRQPLVNASHDGYARASAKSRLNTLMTIGQSLIFEEAAMFDQPAAETHVVVCNGEFGCILPKSIPRRPPRLDKPFYESLRGFYALTSLWTYEIVLRSALRRLASRSF